MSVIGSNDAASPLGSVSDAGAEHAASATARTTAVEATARPRLVLFLMLFLSGLVMQVVPLRQAGR